MAQRKRVAFVVDDETIIAKTLAVILSTVGFSAIAFDDPTEALTAASTTNPDLLITDVMMPKMTGIQLAVLFRNAYPECRVLLFSGHISTGDLLAQAKADGHDFEILAKPVHPTELLAKLRESE
jgi:DNA-binding response OmpR family regulator